MAERSDLPTYQHVLDAAARIRPHLRITPLLHSDALDALAGARLVFKCENLQHSGSFKFRGACNAVLALDDADARRGDRAGLPSARHRRHRDRAGRCAAGEA